MHSYVRRAGLPTESAPSVELGRGLAPFQGNQTQLDSPSADQFCRLCDCSWQGMTSTFPFRSLFASADKRGLGAEGDSLIKAGNDGCVRRRERGRERRPTGTARSWIFVCPADVADDADPFDMAQISSVGLT